MVNFYYLNRLADEDLKEMMGKNIKELLEGVTGQVEFEGKVRTRKEIFDILVERASKTEGVEKEKLIEEEEESHEKFKEEVRELNEFQDSFRKELEELGNEITEECKL